LYILDITQYTIVMANLSETRFPEHSYGENVHPSIMDHRLV
jgi:hypothetical protein